MNRKTKYIFGNWKLNKSLAEITKFFSIFNEKSIVNKGIVYGFAPTHLGLGLASNLKKKQTVIVAQDVSENECGSFTGQISCVQLKDYKINYAIVGHSETRKYLGCNDKNVNNKIKTCLTNKITPIVCIGESLITYNKKETRQFLSKQLKNIFKDVDASKCIVAYEPLWAIGTGKTPTLIEINKICNFIKKQLKSATPVLYGGSVNEYNAINIVALQNVDGLLIGGTSLDPLRFNKILDGISKWVKK